MLKLPVAMTAEYGAQQVCAWAQMPRSRITTVRQVRLELREQLRIGWPVSLGMLLMRSFTVVSMVSVGYLCSVEMFAAACLGTTFANVTGHSIMVGLSSAQATIASQAFGARDYRRMNESLGRSLVVLLGASVPITVLWLWSERVLRAADQSAEVSSAAGSFLIAFIPSLWLYAVLQSIQTWLQAQGVTRPIAVTSAVAAALHPIINYVMIIPLRLGYLGAAYSNAVTQLLWLIMLVAYIRLLGLAKRVGLQLSRELVRASFSHLMPFMKLALPGMLMIAEWWAAESIILLGGMLSNPTVAVSTLSIYQTVNAVAYMVDYGVHVAANTRVGNELGAGCAAKARLASRVAPCFAMFLSGVMAILLQILKEYYPFAFTRDPATVDLTKMTATVGSFLIFADGVQAACTGILKGSGKQLIGSVSTLLSYFGIGIPIAIVLGFRYHMGAVGLCIGLAVGCYMYMLSTLAIVLRTDWAMEVEKARLRLEFRRRPPGGISQQSGGNGVDVGLLSSEMAPVQDVVKEPSDLQTHGSPTQSEEAKVLTESDDDAMMAELPVIFVDDRYHSKDTASSTSTDVFVVSNQEAMEG